MLYLTADNHFGHANAIKHCQRPFATVSDMDDAMTTIWNQKVTPSDTVVVVGDFIWPTVKDPEWYVKQLHGSIVLIPGDHDCAHIDGVVMGKDIADYNYKGRHIICSHWPQVHWRRSHYGSWHVYGHLHNSSITIPQWGKSVNVGCDNFNFEPISFEELQNIMSVLPDNPNLIRRDDGIVEPH